MKRHFPLFLFSILFLLLSSRSVFAARSESLRPVRAHAHVPVCQRGQKDTFNCNVRVTVDDKGAVIRNLTPVGYGPLQLTTGYNLKSSSNSSQVIAIVDAFDNPKALSDLNTYSATFGLPTMSNCAVSKGTPSSPCFQKVNQNGGTSYPRANSGWILESSLDVQVAHAICPQCSLLLVEARSNSYSDLMTAVDRARLMGAKVISNSYGSNEFSSETALDSHFNFPGIMFIFSSGDSGYGAQYPASSRYVTAVGGTSLYLNPDNTYLSETAWSGAGSGCSLYETKPTWQHDLACPKRTVADVSAVADPNTGAAVYDSYGYGGSSGWFQVGGTSLASPLIAGVYALSGAIPATTLGSVLPYAFSSTLNIHDVVTGSNGSCSGSYLCTALSGYDGPTGLGSPLGTTAF